MSHHTDCLRTLKQLSAFLGSDQLISVSREISKIHEENKRGKIIEIISYYELKKPKGEFVIIVSKNKNIANFYL